VTSSKRTNVSLWIVQGLLAVFFGLGSGAPKLFLPVEMLAMPLPLPHLFVQFIGIAEILGALGLILPGVTHVRPGLTPLAARGLVVVAVSATVYQLAAHQPESAIFAFVMALITAAVGYGRSRLAPHRAAKANPMSLAAVG
jgi:hypothetical protein